ncbi:MAG TPA: 5-formyltetrahydrofolate cyclo-ligase [Lachnospiraceae bacterium]|jgi:5-formyltetrahydrofolate cyclo-ligase|nr:5-formyltetrahydrofolate cyclo-ligase [Lachnospiraceae bacterium]
MFENIYQEQKEALRENMKKMRDAIPEDQRKIEDAQLLDIITKTALYQEAESILTYVSFGSEVSTRDLIDRAMKDGKKVYVPRVNGDTMEFYRFEEWKELEESRLGILEPDKNPAKRFPYELHISLDRAQDCVFIVPGLAFDSHCNRLGYGGGYYDKYLQGFEKRMTLGIAYSEQIVDRVPVTNKDQSLDLVVTPQGAFY